MNQNYEQLNTATADSFSNPFTRTRKGGYSEIIRGKNRFGKYIFIFSIGLLIIILCIFLASKSSQLSTLKQENSSLNDKLSQVNAQEHDLKQQYNQLNAEKVNLSKQNTDLSNSIQEYEEKNKKLEQENNANTDTINDIKAKLTSTNEKIAQLTEENNKAGLEISNLEINSKTYTAEIEDLQNKIKELEKKINNINGGKSSGDSGSILIDPDVKPSQLSIDSEIVTDPSSLRLLLKWVNNDFSSFKLLYRATRDGFTNSKFHNAVDGEKNTIILIRDDRDNVIGGYASVAWDNSSGFKEDPYAFVFNLSLQKMYPVENAANAIYCSDEYLCVFGNGDILIAQNQANSKFPSYYGRDADRYELTGGDSKIRLTELEVFKLR